MSALPQRPALQVCTMHMADLDAVLAIENLAYSHPWSRGNFVDAMAAGYDLSVLYGPGVGSSGAEQGMRATAGAMLGYFVVMAGVEEVHLLNLTVTASAQGRGYARHLLDLVCQRAVDQARPRVWLEVRQSNARARAIYERYGFVLVGRRKAYYPLSAEHREDALVMNLNLSPESVHGVE